QKSKMTNRKKTKTLVNHKNEKKLINNRWVYLSIFHLTKAMEYLFPHRLWALLLVVQQQTFMFMNGLLKILAKFSMSEKGVEIVIKSFTKEHMKLKKSVKCMILMFALWELG